MRLFKKNYWFITFKIAATKKEKNIPQYLVKKIKRYFWWCRQKVNFFDPHTGRDGYTTLAFGTATVEDKANRNVVIFLMELYASIQDSSKEVTKDFFYKTMKYREFELTFYKVPKFYWKETKKSK